MDLQLQDGIHQQVLHVQRMRAVVLVAVHSKEYVIVLEAALGQIALEVACWPTGIQHHAHIILEVQAGILHVGTIVTQQFMEQL